MVFRREAVASYQPPPGSARGGGWKLLQAISGMYGKASKHIEPSREGDVVGIDDTGATRNGAHLLRNATISTLYGEAAQQVFRPCIATIAVIQHKLESSLRVARYSVESA